MELRPLGQTGIRVSPLGLGTVKLGRDHQVKYPHAFTIPEDAQAERLLQVASELGVNLLDTAPAYGHAQERLGRLLEGWREDWAIVTKVGETFEDGESSFDFTPAAVRESVEQSLRDLRTDRVECVLLHSDGADRWLIEQSGAVQTLEDLKREGKCRAIGASTKTPEGAILAARRLDVAMCTLNLQERRELPSIREAGRLGAGVLIKKGFASGHVALGGARQVEASLRLILGEPAVSSLIVGTINVDHLRENVRLAERILG